MTVPPPPKRRTRRRWLIGLAIGAGALVALVAAAILAAVIGAAVGGSVTAKPDETAVSPGTDAPADAQRRAFYSFGHTAQTVPVPVPQPAVIEQRLPFRPTVEAGKYRVVVRNLDYRGDVDGTATLAVDSIYLGPNAGDGRFDLSSTVRLSGAGTIAGSDALTTEWFDASTLRLGPDGEYLLGVSFSAPAGSQLGVSPAVGWVRSGAPAGPLTADANRGEYVRAGMFLDIAIEFAFDDPDRSVPVVAVLGHSLNSGANANPAVPHDGEESAWHQIWAREHGGVASSMSAVGSWTANFLPTSPKWALASAVDPDYVAIWSSSSDLVAGATLNDVGVAWVAVIDEARRVWPNAKIVAFTEPPRGAQGAGEATRNAWNEFLRTKPAQLDALVDVDVLVADPSDPSVLDPEINGDDSHMSPAGNARVAAAFAQAIGEAGR